MACAPIVASTSAEKLKPLSGIGGVGSTELPKYQSVKGGVGNISRELGLNVSRDGEVENK